MHAYTQQHAQERVLRGTSPKSGMGSHICPDAHISTQQHTHVDTHTSTHALTLALTLALTHAHEHLLQHRAVLDNLWQPYNSDNPGVVDSGDTNNHIPRGDMLTVLKFVGLVPRSAAEVVLSSLGSIDQMSARDRMLLSVARALLQRPVMLVLEDLALSVDAKAMNDLDQMLVNQKHLTILHTSTVAARIHCFKRVVVMHNGMVVQDGAPKDLLAEAGVLSNMVHDTGPVASNRLRAQLGTPARVLPSTTSPVPPTSYSSSDARDLASTVGVLGSISELESEETPEKGGAHVAPEAQAPAQHLVAQQACVYEALDDEVVRMLQLKPQGYLFQSIQSCVAALHDSLQVCVYVCVRVRVYVRTCVSVSMSVSVSISVSVSVSVSVFCFCVCVLFLCLYLCVCERMYVQICARLCVHECMCMCVCACTNVHVFVQVYQHASA